MRNIETAISQMLEYIPSTKIGLINGLQKIIYESGFTAPESMGIRWSQAHDILYYSLKFFSYDKEYWESADSEWELEILSIFSTHSKDVIKEEWVKTQLSIDESLVVDYR